MNSKRGEVVTILVVVLAAVGVGLVAGWKPLAMFSKGPQTAQLAQAQEKERQAVALLKEATDKLKLAEQAQLAAKDAQVGYSQQMVTGASLSLAKAPKSPEVVLASSLLERALLGLNSAIGDLPADKRLQIVTIVDGVLSAKQAEIDAANVQLSALDAQLKAETGKRMQVEALLPVLQQEVAANQADVTAAQAKVEAKTHEVAAYADKAHAKEVEAGSLGETVQRLVIGLAALVLLYLAAHVWLPSMGQSYPGTAWEKLALLVRNTTSTHD